MHKCAIVKKMYRQGKSITELRTLTHCNSRLTLVAAQSTIPVVVRHDVNWTTTQQKQNLLETEEKPVCKIIIWISKLL